MPAPTLSFANLALDQFQAFGLAQQRRIIGNLNGLITDLTSGDKDFKFNDVTINGQTTQQNVVRKYITKVDIADVTTTSVLRIETTNETGSTDGGVYSCKIHATICHGTSSASGAIATKSMLIEFGRAMIGAGTGVNTAVSEILETASAATNASLRDIGTITWTLTETSEYQNDLQVNIDLTGSIANTAVVGLSVELIYVSFLTAPTITAL